MADPVTVLCICRTTPDDRARIQAVDARLKVIDAGGWFDGEIRDTWPADTAAKHVPKGSHGIGTRAERDAMLAAADIVLINFPFPLDIRTRGTNLKWVHQRPAGVSNLRDSDLWDCDIPVTSSRGFAASTAIAEYAIAGFFHFARGLHQAGVDRVAQAFDKPAYRPMLLTGKTCCVVGAGGIGREVGRMAAANGMRVVGTRRSGGGDLPEGFSEMRGADGLHELLAQSDVVAVCCQWTPETHGMIDAKAFAAMKPGTILVNVARGEIIDEEALIAALAEGKLRGAALDVYVGEFEGPPDERLWRDPRVAITPHISGGADGRIGTRFMDVFCRNLEAFLAGRPLDNVIDWQRGY